MDALPADAAIELAAALERAPGLLEACPGAEPLGAPVVGHRERTLARLAHAAVVPVPIRELAWQDGLRTVRALGPARCGSNPTGDTPAWLVPFRELPAPPCVAYRVEHELDAAAILAAWGEEGAAHAVADAATRWREVACPPPLDLSGSELDGDAHDAPFACACGAVAVQEPRIAYGYPPPGGPLLDLGLEVVGGCVIPARPEHRCPSYAQATDARPRRAEPLAVQGRKHLLAVAGDGDRVRLRHIHEIESCGVGGAEWLGAWIPWDDSAGSACVAQVADERLARTRWAVLLVDARR